MAARGAAAGGYAPAAERLLSRTLGRRASWLPAHAADLSVIGAVDVVEHGSACPDKGATVGVVAERLAVDPSRASRLVASAVQAGYLRRVASQADGRRIQLELTDAGLELMDGVRQYRHQYFADLLQDWTSHDRDELARLLTKLAQNLG